MLINGAIFALWYCCVLQALHELERASALSASWACAGVLRHTTSRLQQAPSPAGAASRSFTSTAVNVVTKNTRQRVRVERNPSKKGYLRLHTNLGDLNLELHCDIAPRTCENFILLAESGYYTGTKFHRLIKNFMIQVGLIIVVRPM